MDETNPEELTLGKPVVDLGGEQNPWKLLVRVRQAMRDARLGRHVIQAFESLAGADEIKQTPTADLPKAVYARVVRAAEQWCELRVLHKETTG